MIDLAAPNPSDEFLLLNSIFEDADELAQGHGAEPLTKEQQDLLIRLARGGACSKAEAKKATQLAAGNRIAMEFLAEQLAAA